MRRTREPPRRRHVEPAEWIVHDGLGRCPYLAGEIARLPLRIPARPLTREELSQRLAEGDRRQGMLLYRPHCPACRACEPIRIEVDRFQPGRTQRRILRRGDADLSMRIRRPGAGAEKVALYNRHKIERGLLVRGEQIDIDAYEEFLVDSCANTIELSYRSQGRLVAVSVVDRAADALSAVYTYFDPQYGRLSPGAYSILKQITLCRDWNLRYLYLGYYVAGCRAMTYKAKYLPHERLIGGRWLRFDGALSGGLGGDAETTP